MVENDEQMFLEEARRGNASALGSLLDQFRPYARFLVHASRTRNGGARQDDSDIIQDAMLDAHRAFPRFRGTTTAEFAAWLRVLTLRSCGRARRTHAGTGKRDQGREESVGNLGAIADTAAGLPDVRARQHEQVARLAAALERLPADMQEVVRGRAFLRLDYAELAERMKRSPGALRVLHTRALRRLSEELGVPDGEET